MGTNYYLKKNVCRCCGRGDEIHIGKSSGGWCFALHVYPEDGINDISDWIAILCDDGNSIRDEYGQALNAEEMLSVITSRMNDDIRWELSPYGYDSWAAFHEKNHSERGPNGLLRHRVEAGHCVAHGKGTYDYIVGEFS